MWIKRRAAVVSAAGAMTVIITSLTLSAGARQQLWLTIVIPDFLELLDLPEGNAVLRFSVGAECADRRAGEMSG